MDPNLDDFNNFIMNLNVSLKFTRLM